MTIPDYPPFGPDPVPPPPRKSRLVNIVGAIAVAAALGLGFLIGSVDGDDKPAAKNSHSTTAPVEPLLGQEPGPTYKEFTADDFLLELKTTSKKCYGYGVGCNVTVEPELSFLWNSDDIDPDAFYDITYEITGDENGTVTETLTLSDQDDISYSKSFLSTASSGTEIEVEIISVEAR